MSSKTAAVDLLNLDSAPGREQDDCWSMVSEARRNGQEQLVSGLVGSQVQCTDTKKQPGCSIQEVCNMQEVISAKDFINGLREGLEPANVRLAENIESVVGNSLASVLHLQRSLPARLQDLLQDVEQVRDTTGNHLQAIMGRSGLTGKDIKVIQERIELIEAHVFGDKMSHLLEMVRGCQTDFTKTQGGYDEAMRREESDLFFRHRVADSMKKHLYKPIEMVTNLNPDWVLAATSVGTTFCLKSALLAWTGGCVGVLAAGALGMKLYLFGPSADFQEIQKQADKNMKEVRRIKTMGKSMDQYLQTMQEDINILQNCRMQFQQTKESLPCLEVRCFDAFCWDASTLSAALKEHDQPEAAAKFLEKNISGRAFIEVTKEQDLEDWGLDDITRRCLLDLQAEWKKKEGQLVRATAKDYQRSLEQAFERVIECIRTLKDKYCY